MSKMAASPPTVSEQSQTARRYANMHRSNLLFDGPHERLNVITPWPMGLELCVLPGPAVHDMPFVASPSSIAARNLVVHGMEL